ncbi:uncharacterized protein LOC126902126 [Daktulosphaira vitifoliae]|uniref:uncharacterized protein LOC126902126 n=1 Tax=Daktulosphaira vitifoliae TaxID=58002 RepID=UPI0021AAA6B4|nr:uncharacterized protein LOC126902126 [Daktulosphaira vitifoliae]
MSSGVQNKKRFREGECCTEQTKMLSCALAAMENMKKMFATAYSNVIDPSDEKPTGPCLMNAKCRIPKGCPFRGTGLLPNNMRQFCNYNFNVDHKPMLPDPASMQLKPGEVGLRGDRATFHMGYKPRQSFQIVDGKPAGAVYYNLPAVDKNRARKHVVQVLPALPGNSMALVGPVTGLPITDDEDVFVLRMGKRYEEPDEKAKIQVEVRLPKKKNEQLPPQVQETQYLVADLGVTEEKSQKGSKKGSKKKSKKKGEIILDMNFNKP